MGSSTDGHGGGCKAAAGGVDTSVASSNASSNGGRISSERRKRYGGGNALYLVPLSFNVALASAHSPIHGSSAGSNNGGMVDRSSSRERRSEADDSASNGRSTVGDPGSKAVGVVGVSRHSRQRGSNNAAAGGGEPRGGSSALYPVHLLATGRCSSRERRSEAEDSDSNGRSTVGDTGGDTRHSRHRCSGALDSGAAGSCSGLDVDISSDGHVTVGSMGGRSPGQLQQPR